MFSHIIFLWFFVYRFWYELRKPILDAKSSFLCDVYMLVSGRVSLLNHLWTMKLRPAIKPAPEIPNNPTLRRSIGELKKCPEHWNFEPKVMFLSWMFFFNDMSGFFHGRVKPLRWTSARENVQGEVGSILIRKTRLYTHLEGPIPMGPQKIHPKISPLKKEEMVSKASVKGLPKMPFFQGGSNS